VPRRLAFTEEGLVSELRARGTHRGEFLGVAPTGERLQRSVTIFLTFRDGRMAGERLHYDLCTLLRQLGVTTIPLALAARP
jgi:predicted ester cyclase